MQLAEKYLYFKTGTNMTLGGLQDNTKYPEIDSKVVRFQPQWLGK